MLEQLRRGWVLGMTGGKEGLLGSGDTEAGERGELQMPDRPRCHTEHAKTWLQELTLWSEIETLDLKLFSPGCSLGGISKDGQGTRLCNLQESAALGIPHHLCH